MANSRKKKCKVCKASFAPWSSTQVVCSVGCARQFARSEREKKEAKQLRERKQALKSKGDLTKEVQTVFNQFIRFRDYHDPCISCGITVWEIEAGTAYGKTGGLWDAGHYLSRGARPEHRFNEDNCHKQCKRCNGGAGNWSRSDALVAQRYRENLIKKIGVGRVEAIEVDHDPKKYTAEQLIELKKHYQAKCRELKKSARAVK